jgi:hypothetical protein
MAIGKATRKFEYQNPTSGKLYEVTLLQNADGTVDGKGLLQGTNRNAGDPEIDNTKVTFVVITTQQGVPFGFEGLMGTTTYKTKEHLMTAAIYDASNRGGAGALLSTLLV